MKASAKKLALEYIRNALATLGAISPVYEIIEQNELVTFSLKIKLLILFSVSLFVPAVIFIWKNFHFRCNVDVRGCIRIKLGNLLRKKKGFQLVPINDRLITSEPNSKITSNSIHEQLLNGSEGLAIYSRIKIEQKPYNGKNVPIGHYFTFEKGKHHILFLATSHRNDENGTEVTLEDLRKAIHTLFTKNDLQGITYKSMYIPVIGTGAAEGRFTHEDVIKMIAKEYIICRSQATTCNASRIRNLEIVISWNDRQYIKDWKSTCEDIRAMAQLCAECQKS